MSFVTMQSITKVELQARGRCHRNEALKLYVPVRDDLHIHAETSDHCPLSD